MSPLKVENLSMAYANEESVLNKVSFQLEPGEIVAAVGQSGSGKTSLLRAIAGFEKIDEGTVSVNGIPVNGPGICLLPEKRLIGFVFQDLALFPHLTVEQNIAFGIRDKQRSTRITSELIQLVNLDGLGKRFPWQLSGGQQQRVAIARALATKPAVLLMDEPFSSLDQNLRFQVRAEVLDILVKSGTSAVIVTHDIDDAFAMANRMLVLDHGNLIQFDTPRNTYLYPVNQGVALLGGKANILDGSLLGLDKPGMVVIRPEHICPSNNNAHWTIISSTFNGSYMEYELAKGDVQLVMHSAINLLPGETTGISIESHHIHHL